MFVLAQVHEIIITDATFDFDKVLVNVEINFFRLFVHW